MKEINEKEMEQATGGSAWNEPYYPTHRIDDCCDDFEMDMSQTLPPNWESMPQLRKCLNCAHAKRGYVPQKINCMLEK